jgi:hypothetical protein
MKRPSPASLKKVNAENLVALGAERLAQILVGVAETRPEVKRRLRMELAAEQGAEHLWPEIDRRLNSLSTSRSKVSWRQRPTFVRDLDSLRAQIAERLADLDRPAALDRLWLFMDLAKRLGARVKDRDGEMAAVFARAAADLGRLASEADAQAMADAIARNPMAWAEWAPATVAAAPPGMAAAALRALAAKEGATPGWMPVLRLLADAAGDIDAFRATFPAQALKVPANAAEVARRLLAAGQLDKAARVLDAGRSPAAAADFDWESAWIAWLEASGRREEAQAARWASFERTLSVERARDFTRDLDDFDDVEAETRAFAVAAKAADPTRALRFLMAWPALAEAGRLIQARADEIDAPADEAEAWAARLRPRNPEAALTLLRRAAAAAFRRRDFKTADRLSAEADAY